MELKPDLTEPYANRGLVGLQLKGWEEARSDLTIAKNMGVKLPLGFIISLKASRTLRVNIGLSYRQTSPQCCPPRSKHHRRFLNPRPRLIRGNPRFRQ